MNEYLPVYFKHNYNLFLEKQSNDYEFLTFNCSGIQLDGLLKIIEKISKCTKLNKLLVTNISNEYADKIDFNFLADLKLNIIDISFAFPAHRMTHFVTNDNILILANMHTELDMEKIISTNFRAGVKIVAKENRLKQVESIMNNLSLDVHNLTLVITTGHGEFFEEICNFIDNGLNNLPISLVNFKIDYSKTLFNLKYYTDIYNKLINIKIPFGCELDVGNYNVLAGKIDQTS
jgi:hypothetical protein